MFGLLNHHLVFVLFLLCLQSHLMLLPCICKGFLMLK